MLWHFYVSVLIARESDWWDANMLHENTKVKLLSGEILSLKEMSELDSDFFVYSIDSNFNFFPAKIKSINKSYSDEIFVTKIDCGDSIQTTQDHLFVRRDLDTVCANLLRKDDSLLPMHFKINTEQYNYDREMMYDINSNQYVFTHHKVMNYMEPKISVGGFDIHHIDENHRNNNPTNLIWLDSNKHKTFHEREKQCKFSKERDQNFNNDQKRNAVLASAACLIRKYFILDKDLIESKKILGFLRHPINMLLVEKYFETYDDFLRLAYEYEKTLTDQEYKRLTKSPDERKAAKKDLMAKIGRLLLDEGKTINEANYNEKAYQLHLKPQPFSKIEKYFKTFNNYMTYVSNYNHKVVSTQLIKCNEKQAFFNVKLKNSNNFCIALNNNNFLVIHV